MPDSASRSSRRDSTEALTPAAWSRANSEPHLSRHRTGELCHPVHLVGGVCPRASGAALTFPGSG